MIFHNSYTITDTLLEEAKVYALKSRAYTSNRHDFHEGGLDAKQRKMFEGKLGEKAFKMFLLENSIPFNEDHTSHTERDYYDFLVNDGRREYTIDVKTRTESFHTRTLEMVEQATRHPKDIYISTRLYRPNNISFLGWFTIDDLLNAHPIENQGYLDNYVMYDNDLRPMEELYNLILKNCI